MFCRIKHKKMSVIFFQIILKLMTRPDGLLMVKRQKYLLSVWQQKCRATNTHFIHRIRWKACFQMPYDIRDFLWYVRLDMRCLMNRPKICPINLLWESGPLHRLSAILSFWPCWEWWLDPSQPAIDGLALDQDDWVALLSMHVALCVVVRGCACLPCMHAAFSEQQHICVTPSPLSHLNFVFSQSSPVLLCSVPGLWAAEDVNKYSWLCHQIIIKT